MFIAPEGAMQFHFYKTKASKKPIGGEIAFWVTPYYDRIVDDRRNACSCTRLYRVLYDSLPPGHQAAWKQLATNLYSPNLLVVVCACQGDVIE